MAREGMKLVLEATGRMTVVGETDCPEEAVRISGRENPDILVVDFGGQGTRALRAIRRLRAGEPEANVLVIADPEQEESIDAIVEAGALGCIGRNCTAEDLLIAVDLVSNGRMRLPHRASQLRSPSPWPLLLFAGLLVAAACESSADTELPGGVPFLEEDSAGVRVATTLGTRARSPVGWVVDAVPEYQVGELDGEEPYLFTTIEGAHQLPDGRVVVVDRSSCELRFFGTDGVFLKRTGGRGEGPGEFRQYCALAPSADVDSLFVYDIGRLSVFDDRGRFIRRVNLLWPGHRPRVVGVADGVAGLEAGVRNIPSAGHPTFRQIDVDYAMLELEPGRVVWEERGFQWHRTYRNVMPGGTTSVVPIAFDITPVAAMGRDGFYVALGENHGPEIRQYGTAGLSRLIRLAEPSAGAPSTADIRALIEFDYAPYAMPDTTRERISRDLLRRYRELPLPEIKPVFSRLLIDDAGWLWAELYRFEVEAPVRWLVFDPHGEGVGSVDMPPDLHLWQIGQDFVLGVWMDEHRVEYVRRHALIGRE